MKYLKQLVLFNFLAFIALSCNDNMEDVRPATSENPDWTEESHGGNALPNYELVFPDDKVNTVEIKFKKSTFDSLENNLKKNYFDIPFGIGSTKLTPTQINKLSSSGSSQFFGLAAPSFFEASITFNNKVWNNVGFKFDQAYPLLLSYLDGIKKMPFRLQFNKFQIAGSSITNQKLHGFNELQFISGYNDISMIRDKIGADIFRENGVIAPKTSFCKVYIDYGEGRKYYGLYTTMEVPEDAMIKTKFGENTGNIYEPETTMKFYSKSSFYKKNNQAQADYADVETLVAILNSTKRKSNYAEWKANLEKHFDIDTYLKWLAINICIRADEGYVSNFTLYNMANRKLTWIPSGFNYSLKLPPVSTNPNIPDTDTQIDLTWKKTSEVYPLIRYIMDDPSYFEKYKKHVEEFNKNYFSNGKLEALIDKNHNLIAPFIIGAEMEVKPYSHLAKSSDFDKGKIDIKSFLVTQGQNIREFLK
jgi:spore coat protein H